MLPCGSGPAVPTRYKKYASLLKAFTLLGRDFVAGELLNISIRDNVVTVINVHVLLHNYVTGRQRPVGDLHGFCLA
jgi:hypothetical protein